MLVQTSQPVLNVAHIVAIKLAHSVDDLCIVRKIMPETPARSQLLHAAAGPADPVYSDPYYMTMVGDAGQIPDFSNPSMLRSAAQGLHNAFGLDPTYPATSIKVWQEGGNPVARRRHLLQSGKQVLIIGYAFAQPEAAQTLPEAAALKEAVAAAAGKITASLVSVGVLSDVAAASLAVGLLAPETTPQDVLVLLKEAPAVLLDKLDKLKGDTP